MTHEQKTAPSNVGQLWAVVLAGGEGTRLASVTRLLCGRELPKQYVALENGRTLLQRTMDRLSDLVPPHRTVVVVASERRELAEAQLASFKNVQIICQPENAGTGPGLLLPLSLIRAQCPEAMVVVTPSDHFLPNQSAFLSALGRAAAVAPHAPAGLALLGADAEGPSSDLGWIVATDQAAAPDAKVDLVERFVEKPSPAEAKKLFRAGGLLNTLIVVGSVRAFWTQASRHMPRQTSLFSEYVDVLVSAGGRPDDSADQLLRRLYRSLPPADFSRGVLEKANGLAVVHLENSGWCDCGTPERLLNCLGGAGAPSHSQRQLRDLILGSLQDADRRVLQPLES